LFLFFTLAQPLMAIPKLRWLICLAVHGLTGCGKYADDLFCDDR